MSKHTPGPWKLVKSTATDMSTGWPVAILGDCAVISGPMHADSLGTHEDDARLIAAAPELLEALKDAHDQVKGVHGPAGSAPETCGHCAVIAKAEGRSHG